MESQAADAQAEQGGLVHITTPPGTVTVQLSDAETQPWDPHVNTQLMECPASASDWLKASLLACLPDSKTTETFCSLQKHSCPL